MGLIALAMMCGGDGIADIAGRNLHGPKLPYNPDKSVIGSAAMLVGMAAHCRSADWPEALQTRPTLIPHIC